MRSLEPVAAPLKQRCGVRYRKPPGPSGGVSRTGSIKVRGNLLATQQELAAFLAEVERRAFKQAVFAVRDQHSALDIVQDAMLKLTDKYAGKPAAELPLLFQRILFLHQSEVIQ